MEQICDALATAHDHGVVHRDIKPANVMIDDRNSVKLVDFGIARLSDSTMTQSGMLVGTLNYMSPEQVMGTRVDHRSDMWAVGALMYELLTYRRAFQGTLDSGILHRILYTEPIELRRIVPSIDRRIAEITARTLAKDRVDRFSDMRVLQAELASVRSTLSPDALADVSVADPDASTIVARPVRSPRRRWPALLAGAAFVATCGSVIVKIVGERRPTAIDQSAAPDSAPNQTPTPVPSESSTVAARTGEDARLRNLALAQQEYRRGNREGALNSADRGLRLNPADAELDAIVSQLANEARASVDRARRSAELRLGGEVQSSAAFQRAVSRHSAALVELKSNPAQGIRALWNVVDLFELAPGEQRQTAMPMEKPMLPTEAPQSDPAFISPANEPVVPVQRGSQTEPVPDSRGERPANPSPLAPTVTPTLVTTEPSAEVTSPDDERQAIERLLNEYRSAYEALDLNRVLNVFPSLPDRTTLARAFADAREVRIGFSRPEISVESLTSATVSLNRTLEIVPKIGNSRPDKRRLAFSLQKTAGRWLIVSIQQ